MWFKFEFKTKVKYKKSKKNQKQKAIPILELSLKSYLVLFFYILFNLSTPLCYYSQNPKKLDQIAKLKMQLLNFAMICIKHNYFSNHFLISYVKICIRNHTQEQTLFSSCAYVQKTI